MGRGRTDRFRLLEAAHGLAKPVMHDVAGCASSELGLGPSFEDHALIVRALVFALQFIEQFVSLIHVNAQTLAELIRDRQDQHDEPLRMLRVVRL